MRPASGVRRPVRQEMRLVFPAPFCPIRTYHDFGVWDCVQVERVKKSTVAVKVSSYNGDVVRVRVKREAGP